MNKRYALIDKESLQPFFSLLLFCGIALILSIPPARRIQHFDAFSLLSGIPAYFYAHALFIGIFGLNVGATSVARGERAFVFPLLAGRILLAQFLLLPYVLFERALFPGKEAAVVLFLVYTTLVGVLCAVASRLIEEPWQRTSSRGFLLKYTLFTIYYVVSLVSLPILSPLGMVASLLHGEPASLLILAYAVPLLLLGVVSFLLNRQIGKDHGV